MRGIDNLKKTRGEATTTMQSLRMKLGEAAGKASAPPLPTTLKIK